MESAYPISITGWRDEMPCRIAENRCYRSSFPDAALLGGVGHHALFLLPEALDGDPHHIAGLEEHRTGLDAHAHARRRAGGDDVARQERHVVTHVRDDLRHAEDHGARIAVLHL